MYHIWIQQQGDNVRRANARERSIYTNILDIIIRMTDPRSVSKAHGQTCHRSIGRYHISSGTGSR
jgi:hypothetical protein